MGLPTAPLNTRHGGRGLHALSLRRGEVRAVFHSPARLHTVTVHALTHTHTHTHNTHTLHTHTQAIEQLLEVEAARGGGAYGPDSLAVGIARLQVRGGVWVGGCL